MINMILNRQIFVQNSFYGLISPTVENIEIIVKNENYCRFKIIAILKNIDEYYLQIEKISNNKNEKLFTNYITPQNNYNYILNLKNNFLFLNTKYSVRFNKELKKNLIFETEIEICREGNKIDIFHNRINKHNDSFLFHKYIPSLNENGFFGDKIIRTQFSLYYCPYNTGDARLTTSKNISMDNIIENFFLTLFKEKGSEYFCASICYIQDDDKIEKININHYISEYLELFEKSLNEEIKIFNNYGFKDFENSLKKLSKFKSNFVINEIFELLNKV